MASALNWVPLSLAVFAAGSSKAEPQPAPVAESEEKADLGQGRLRRRALENFDDFAEVSLAELMGEGDRLRFSLNAFGDTGVALSAGDNPTFITGALALLVDANLMQNVTALAEVAVEASSTNEVGIDLERLHLKWSNKHFYVMAGRIHTDLGYWNTAYHHGKWLQPTIDRPDAVKFEDDSGLFPNHSIGVVFGLIQPHAIGILHVLLQLSNGRGGIVDSIQMQNDNNINKAVMLSVYNKDTGIKGLRLGGGVMLDTISAEPAAVRPALPDVRMTEWLLNGHAIYTGNRLLLMAEWYAYLHQAANQQWVTQQPYALVGYEVTDRFFPYLMAEGMLRTGPSPDPFFVPDPTAPDAMPLDPYVRMRVGMRFETSNWSALKIEYRIKASMPLGAPEHFVGVNWSFGI